MIDPDGIAIDFAYDDAHRLIDVSDAAGNHIHYTLDASGNRIKEEVFDAYGISRRVLTRSYNSRGQLVSVADGSGQVVFDAKASGSYDVNGNLLAMKDAMGVVRKDTFDARNRLITSVANANGSDIDTKATTTVFGFDAMDHITSVTDPDGLATTYAFDGLGNAVGQLSPDTGIQSATFNAAGDAVTRMDAKRSVATHAYDALGRRSHSAYPGDSIAYYYDDTNAVTGCSSSFPLGRVTRVMEKLVTTAICYDNQGRVTEQRKTLGQVTDVTGFAYTRAGRLAAVVSPSGVVTEYSRDQLGQISTVNVRSAKRAVTNVIAAATYLPFGPLASYTLGNKQTVSRIYDANYQVTSVTSPALNFHFARNAAGNIIALGDAPGASPPTETYTYDPLYRLTSVKDAKGIATESYTYSRAGDRLSKAGPSLATGSYGYQSGTHWLTQIGNSTRTYDDNGSMTGGAVAGSAWSFGYNERGRLSEVQRAGGMVATYIYDAWGRRVSKTVSSTQTRFAYDEAGHLLSELGDSSYDYVWLDDMPVAVLTGEAIVFIHADDMGTPRTGTNPKGDVAWTFPRQGNPFGEMQPATANGTTINLRFPGQYYDSESGLLHNGFRDYSPEIGRYIQSDPIGLRGGLSTYAYVGGNPLRYTDPLGLWQVTITAGLGVGGLLTFGYNSGQFNIGGYLGVGGGASVAVNIDDLGCHEVGAWRGTRGDARLGVGVLSANVSATVGPGVNDGEVAVGTPIKALTAGVAVSDGHYSQRPITGNVTVGESAFLGYGGQMYFGH